MPLRSPFGQSRDTDRAADRPAVPEFTAAEWELLVRLPARVLAAAASVHTPTDEEKLAGLAAIAAGRMHDSELLRAVVARVYRAEEASETGNGTANEQERAGLPGSAEPRASLLAACRMASRLLALRADRADAAAYRQWLQSIAARFFGVTGAAREALTDRQREFLDDLAAALSAR